METKSIQVFTCLAALVLFACVHVAQGIKICFLKDECKEADRVYQPIPIQDCCQSPQNANGTLYYRISNTSIPLFFQIFQARSSCMACGPRTNPKPKTSVSEGKVESSPDKVCTARARMMPNGQLRCFCSGCSRKTYRPVCGNDGGNYSSECELRKKACRHRRFDMEVAYEGTCQYGCDKVVCRNNGTCMVDQYKRASCVQSCDSLCFKQGKKDGPLCGADGVQYESSCHLRRETCKQGKAIGMAYKGKCIKNATCDNINCGNKMCVADASGRPRCVTCSCNVFDPRKANRVCSENLQPMTLCGTDGKTYQHYGSLRKEMCKIKKFIDVDHLGACKGDKVVQGQRPGDEPPDESSTSGETNTIEDINNYYISLKHFVNILKKKYGLAIKAPEYKKMDRRDKVVLMSELIKALRKNLRKIKPYQ